MKQFIAIAIVAALAVAKSFAQTDAEIESLLTKMTLDEKVGQMMQITLDIVTVKGRSPIQLDAAKLHAAIAEHKVGSILNTGLDHVLTPDEWRYVQQTIADVVAKETRLRIPNLYGIDSIHGASYVGGATLFPHSLDMAATRDVALMKHSAEISAAETRAVGLPWTFAPVLDVGRQPLWPRFAETFGEDPTLVATFGAATIHGFQGDDVSSPAHVAACMKHFFGYSFPFTGKDRAPALVPDLYLREWFLPPFREAVRAGVKTVMVNSAEVNGVPVHASHYLLTDILRGELGFTGLVVSDWEDVKHLHDWYRVADSQKEAVRISVDAGIDMSMIPTDYSFGPLLIELVHEGKISERRVNDSVRRILKLKRDLGLFHAATAAPAALTNLARPEYAAVALDAAEQAIVLVKNETNTLPLAKSGKVLVCGPAAKSLAALHGSWSFTWQGHEEKWFPTNTLNIVDAVREKLGADSVLYREGADFAGRDFDGDDAVADAATVDAVILCLGEDAYAEAVGDIPDLTLAHGQLNLAKKLYATGKPVVLVLAEGRPRVIRDIEGGARAILFAGWPGSQGARAIANILFGDANPSGRLAFTYPRQPDNLITYDRTYLDVRASVSPPAGFKGVDFTPQWEFGHGLSYTTFETKNLKLSSAVLKGRGKLTVSVDVTNTGARAGKDAVELYTRDLYASIDPPARRLRAFQKISLQPGETRNVRFEITAADLAFVNAQSKTVTEPGDFEVMIDGLKAGFRYDE
jgi:beta-glucosidase